ncbi:MAG: UvrD-helicase domain-containing protein, partial [Desulfovibrio sp.]|nr:UvrD-helicase domain-containing protein [Desulfovibrio sp.]
VPNAYLIPAHIWTPWFSLFGSRSGFDAIEECFEDLTGEIFALETGLSSDPAMNRLVSALDPYVLIANSDAHSGSKLAREVNIFAGNPSYTGIFQALKAASKREAYQHTLPCSFKGTSEFYPEEGKYHLDGHRSCQISLNPLTSKQHQNICPVCGKPLTIGVLHRVMDLADRRTQPNLPYEPPYTSHMPLLEITAELLNVGANSQKAINEYGSIIEKLGSELDVLTTLPLDVITEYWDLLGVAIERLRKGAVLLKGGYDGEFGEVHLFTKEELGFKPKGKKSKGELSAPKANLATLENFQAMPAQKKTETNLVYSLEQEKAIFHDLSPAVVLAGPGAGKTHLLMGRIKNLASQLPPTSILALTFTRRAAEEMRQRLSQILPNTVPLCTTLHAFCWQLIKKQEPSAQILSEDAAIRLLQDATGLCAETAKKTYRTINLLREQTCLDVDQELKQLFATYQVFIQKTINVPAYDFCAVLEEGRKILQNSDFQFKAVLVDEIQDCSLLNLTLVQALLPKNGTGFFGIGDPDQSIYAFRGACPTILPILERFWGKITLYHLGESFRSGKEILEVAQTFIQKPQCGPLSSAKNLTCQLHFCKAHSQTAEANWIAKQIASLLGSTAHSLLDTQKNYSQAAWPPVKLASLYDLKASFPLSQKHLKNGVSQYKCLKTRLFGKILLLLTFYILLIQPSAKKLF